MVIVGINIKLADEISLMIVVLKKSMIPMLNKLYVKANLVGLEMYA